MDWRISRGLSRLPEGELGAESRVPFGSGEARPFGMCSPRERGPISGPAGPSLCSPRMIKSLPCIPGSPHAATKPTYNTLGQRRDRAAAGRGVPTQVHVC